MDTLQSVSAITIISGLIGLASKTCSILDNKWIPVITGISGAILGALSLNVIPGYPANDIITAVAVGIISGSASTGLHQITKIRRR